MIERMTKLPIVALVAALALTACGGSSTEAGPTATVTVTAASASPSAWDCSPNSELSQAEWGEHCQGVDNSTLDPSASAESNSPIHAFGETVRGEDVTVEVAPPVKVAVPVDTGYCTEEQPKAAVMIKITVKNISKAPWDAGSSVIIDGTSGTETACNMSNPSKNGEYTTIMPTRTGVITKVFGVKDATQPFTVSVGALGGQYWTNDTDALKAAGR